MIAVAVVLLQVAACVGGGALILVAFGLLGSIPAREHLSWSFAIGIGVLGWLVTPLAIFGWLSTGGLLALELALAVGCALLRHRPTSGWSPLTGVEALLIAVLAAVLVFDIIEAMAPPVDTDTLAYHFARPRQVLHDGRIEFVSRAVDGVLPLLLHMTYLPPLKLGGEVALTLWAMVSGAAPGLLLYAVARRWLPRPWALAAAIVLLTTPAWIYGAGAGQVEARLALFAVAGAVATAQSIREDSMAYAALAGLCAGFYAASKYLGLIYVAACGAVILWQHRWFRAAMLYALAALAAGYQWYAWNAVHVGDPIFPALFRWLPPPDPHMWNVDIDTFFRTEYLPTEQPVPANVYWALLYPFQATLAGFSIWESGRTGLGPLGLLLLPFVAAGAWHCRGRLRSSPLSAIALIMLLFYAAWFFFGVSQRVRHLAPILPLFILCSFVAAQRSIVSVGFRAPLCAAIGVTVAMQLGVHALFAVSYMKRFWSGEDREQFLARNVANYAVLPWLNSHLSASDRLLMAERQFTYLLTVPAFYAPPAFQAEIDMRDDTQDIAGQWRDLRRLGITHMLLIPGLADNSEAQAAWRLGRAALASGCAVILDRRQVSFSVSRTLPTLHRVRATSDVLRVSAEPCALDRSD